MSIHFIEPLEQLHRRCLNMAALVQGAVEQITQALHSRRPELAREVMDNEQQIDAQEVEIELAAINLLAKHQPDPTDLRTVFAIVKINSDLERIGDCAFNIAQMVGTIADVAGAIPEDLKTMAEAATRQVHDTTRCLGTYDSDLAGAVCQGDDVIDALYHQIYQDLQTAMIADTTRVPVNLAMIMAAKNYERIADHCTNIAEEVVYLVRGQMIRHVH